mgnify:FL=1|tara:strand:+ start:3933 stop:4250 length:318 start_codon:yes stop_codon:yes gene_type:complete
MTVLNYSTYQSIDHQQNIPIIEGNQTINEYIVSKDKIIENKNNIRNNLENIKSNPVYNIGYDKLDSNEKFDQMIQDSKSILMQDKFLMGLGGLALASLIIVGTQI